MRFVRHAVLAAAAAAVAASGAAAQSVGGTGTGGGLGGTTTGGTGTGGGLGGTTTGGTGGSVSGLTNNSTGSNTAVPTIAGGNISGVSSSTATTGGPIDKSNFLSGTYSNPYFQGTYTNVNNSPGGFGSTLYGTGGGGGSPGTTTTGGVTRSAVGNRTGTAGGANPFGTSGSPFGTGGGTGTRGGAGGGFGAAATSQFGGQVISLPRNIAYAATMRFQAPVVAPAERLADVQAVIARSSMLSSPAGVTVLQDGPAFVLRGQVGNEDEARLAENMVRLTPGVREVRNELVFPRQ